MPPERSSEFGRLTSLGIGFAVRVINGSGQNLDLHATQFAVIDDQGNSEDGINGSVLSNYDQGCLGFDEMTKTLLPGQDFSFSKLMCFENYTGDSPGNFASKTLTTFVQSVDGEGNISLSLSGCTLIGCPSLAVPPTTSPTTALPNSPPTPPALPTSISEVVFVHGVRTGCDEPGKSDDRGAKSYQPLFDTLVGRGLGMYSFCYDHDKAFSTNPRWDRTLCFSPTTSHGPDAQKKATVPFDSKIGPLTASMSASEANASPPDPASGGGAYDTDGPLAYDATKLDNCLAKLVEADRASGGTKGIAVIGNSMGGAIVRGWLQLAKARDSSSLQGVTTAVLLEAATEGSWLAGVGKNADAVLGSPALIAPIIDGAVGQLTGLFGVGLHRPGIKDLAPGSDWYQAIARSGDPPGLHYFTFSVDLVFTAHIQELFWSHDVAFPQFGDGLMQLGDPAPDAVPPAGGSEFLPMVAAPDRHQFTITRNYTLPIDFTFGPLSGGPDTASAVSGVMWAIVSDPYGHFSFGSHIGQDDVDSCDPSRGIIRIPAEISRILTNPATACR